MTSTPSANVEALEPKAVWQFFAGIAAVPRPSGKEEKIRAHLKALAERLKLECKEDKIGNLLIVAPASPGCEKVPTTILQGHVDMVCEKNAGTQHDFENDPIRLQIGQDAASGEQIVKAVGTTLGADNGVGVALALAAATAPDVKHGPLEILCTVDEEAGMTGARHIQPGFVTGQRLINLDSEEDDVIYIGCAGGGDVSLIWDFATQPVPTDRKPCRITVKGLRGGHSGGDIHENRGNAIKTPVRAVFAAKVEAAPLVTFHGGSLRNALPREAHAVFALTGGEVEALKKAAAEVKALVSHESAEPELAILVEPDNGHANQPALSSADTTRLLNTLAGLPHGVLEMHPKVAGLVQTSNNVATVRSEAAGGKLHVIVGALSRSSVDTRLETTRAQIAAVGRLAGAKVELGNSYSGWEPDVDSPLLATCRDIYKTCFGETPKVTAIHAGLECGILGRQIGKLDMVSFGPHITGAHSPDEQVYVASVAKSYRYLVAVLGELTKG